MSISKEDVLHVAELARLDLTEEEVELYTGQIQRILSHMEKLSELDTTGVEPTSFTVPARSVTRPDVVAPSLPQEAALAGAPAIERGCFKVPKIIDQG